MPIGSKIRRRRNSSNVSPEATSTMRPSVSMPAQAAVRPAGARLEVQGCRAERGRPVGDRAGRIAGSDAPRRFASRAAAHQARRAGDQVIHRDLAVCRHGVDGALPARSVGSRHRDLRVAELRDEAGHGVGQADLPLFRERVRHPRARRGLVSAGGACATAAAAALRHEAGERLDGPHAGRAGDHLDLAHPHVEPAVGQGAVPGRESRRPSSRAPRRESPPRPPVPPAWCPPGWGKGSRGVTSSPLAG